MNKILLSTAYFPPLDYFATILSADEITIEKHETYFKQSYRNRCHIATASGMQVLSIPVIKTDGNNTKITGIAPSKIENWQRVHWKTIESAYSKTAYFIHYCDELEEILFRPYPGLLELNDTILKKLLKFLRIDKPIFHSSDFEKQPSGFIDLRMRIHPKKDMLLPKHQYKTYFQAFSPKYEFIPNLSILDLLFAEGPHAVTYLQNMASEIRENRLIE
ncbi:MAG: WbqC family protein [Bacteroidales bacterium]|nr:WbqC family protein [Bacteroidales bacterium]